MSEQQININQADEQHLAHLPGISEKLAGRIIAYREEKGDFEDVAGLAAVPGISKRMVRNMGDRVTVTNVTNATSPEDTAPEEDGQLATAVTPSSEIPPVTIPDASQGEDTPDNGAEPAVIESEAPEPEIAASEPDSETNNELPDQTDGENGQVEVIPVAAAAPETADLPTDEPATEPESIKTADLPPDEPATEPEPVPMIPQPTATQPPNEVAQPQPEPATAVPEAAPPAQRQRSSMIGSITAAVFGAILGTALTLSILFGFNETLQYASSSQADELQRQMETELETIQAEQSQLQSNLEALTAELNDLTTSQTSLSETAVETQMEVESLQSQANELQTRAEELNEQIETIAESSENFEAFLTGLRDLVFNVAGTPEPTPTSTPESLEPEPTRVIIIPTDIPTATPEQAATRHTKANRHPNWAAHANDIVPTIILSLAYFKNLQIFEECHL